MRATGLVCFHTACVLWASLALGNAPPHRYSSDADTVLDRRTGLRWQRSTSSSAANDYCQALVLGGYTDWRLPTMQELLSIVDVTRVNPAIDTAAFPDTPSEIFTSATLGGGRSSYCVHFGTGVGNTCDPQQVLIQYQRCVR